MLGGHGANHGWEAGYLGLAVGGGPAQLEPVVCCQEFGFYSGRATDWLHGPSRDCSISD